MKNLVSLSVSPNPRANAEIVFSVRFRLPSMTSFSSDGDLISVGVKEDVCARDRWMLPSKCDVDLDVAIMLFGFCSDGFEEVGVEIKGDAPAVFGIVEPEDVVDKFRRDDDVGFVFGGKVDHAQSGGEVVVNVACYGKLDGRDSYFCHNFLLNHRDTEFLIWFSQCLCGSVVRFSWV